MNNSKFVKFLGAGLFAAVSAASAANIYKANNGAALDTAPAWTNNAVLGPADIATWDNNVTTAITNALGANLSWGGIQIFLRPART